LISNIDSTAVLTRAQHEELVLDLYFDQNKTIRDIVKIARESLLDIKAIVDKALQEKGRKANKSLSVQAYELFSKYRKLLDVVITLNIGQIPAIQYYTKYLRLVQIGSWNPAMLNLPLHVLILYLYQILA
jgi:hypothetical protein